MNLSSTKPVEGGGVIVDDYVRVLFVLSSARYFIKKPLESQMKDLTMRHGWVVIFKMASALPLIAPPMKEGEVQETLTPVKAETLVVLKSRPTTPGTGTLQGESPHLCQSKRAMTGRKLETILGTERTLSPSNPSSVQLKCPKM